MLPTRVTLLILLSWLGVSEHNFKKNRFRDMTDTHVIQVDRPRSIDGTRHDRRTVGSLVGAIAYDGAIILAASLENTITTHIASDRSSGVVVVADSQVIPSIASTLPTTSTDEEIACQLATSHTRAVIAEGRPMSTIAMIMHPNPPQLLVCHHQMAFSPISRSANFWGPSPNASWILERWYRAESPISQVAMLVMLTLCGTGYVSEPRPKISGLVLLNNTVSLLTDEQIEEMKERADQALDHLYDATQSLISIN